VCALCSLYIVGFRYFCLVTFGLCGLSDWLTALPILKGFLVVLSEVVELPPQGQRFGLLIYIL